MHQISPNFAHSMYVVSQEIMSKSSPRSSLFDSRLFYCLISYNYFALKHRDVNLTPKRCCFSGPMIFLEVFCCSQRRDGNPELWTVMPFVECSDNVLFNVICMYTELRYPWDRHSQGDSITPCGLYNPIAIIKFVVTTIFNKCRNAEIVEDN